MAFYRFLFLFVNWLARVIAHVEVTGGERMPRAGAFLLVANHLTNYDPLVVGMCFKREINFMAKIELFRYRPVAWLITTLRVFPVRRGEVDRVALRHAEDLLRRGRIVALFPEGHRSRTFTAQEAQGGIVLLARRTGAPILPVALTGTEHLLPRELAHWRPWRRPTITVTVGEPFYLPKTAGRADSRALAATVMRHVAALLPPSYRGVYAEDVQASAP